MAIGVFLPALFWPGGPWLVALHTANTVCVWYLARRVGVHFGTAFLTAVGFLVLPIQVEILAGAGNRRALLGALLTLIAWSVHDASRRRPYVDTLISPPARHRSARGPRRGILAPAAYLGAILADPGVLLAPLLFWASSELRADPRKPPTPRAVRQLLPYLFAVGVAFLLRYLWPTPATLGADPWLELFGSHPGMPDLIAGALVLAVVLLGTFRRTHSTTALLAGLIWILFRIVALLPPDWRGAGACFYLAAIGAVLLPAHLLARFATGAKTAQGSENKTANPIRVMLTVAVVTALAIVATAITVRAQMILSPAEERPLFTCAPDLEQPGDLRQAAYPIDRQLGIDAVGIHQDR